jgi:signal transduction histidine kinase
MITIADTGAGIPNHVLDQIYKPFFSTKDPDQGTGLGLSTVARIVKDLGGFVQVTSEVGQGTEFRVYLPEAGCRS